MKKLEIVRCYVKSPQPQRDNPEGSEKTARFIPSEIYRLWRYLMMEVKGFHVSDETVSFWVDEEMYSREKSAYGQHDAVPVVEISFTYFQDTSVGRPVIRYFPKNCYQDIMKFFMKNFSQDHIKGGTSEKPGFFIDAKAAS